MPDIEDDVISDATVYRYNFLSMVAQLVNEQLLPKLNAIPKDESKSVAEPKSPPPTPGKFQRNCFSFFVSQYNFVVYSSSHTKEEAERQQRIVNQRSCWFVGW